MPLVKPLAQNKPQIQSLQAHSFKLINSTEMLILKESS